MIVIDCCWTQLYTATQYMRIRIGQVSIPLAHYCNFILLVHKLVVIEDLEERMLDVTRGISQGDCSVYVNLNVL